VQVPVRIDGKQYKSLYIRLLLKFVESDELIQTLSDLTQVPADEILEEAQEAMAAFSSLTPTGDALEETLYLSDAGEVVGLDVVMPVLYKELEGTQGVYAYDRLTQPGKVSHTISGRIFQQGLNNMEFNLGFAREQSEPQTRKLNVHLEGSVQGEGLDNAGSLDITDTRTVARDAETETVEEKTVMTAVASQPVNDWIAQLGGEEQVDDMMRTLLESAREQKVAIDVNRKTSTQALEGDDFVSDTVIVVTVDGKEMAALTLALSSAGYTPPAAPVKLQNITSLTPEDSEEISQALERGASLAQISAFQKIPMSVLALIQDTNGLDDSGD
jgi:hypothetical protein